VFSRVRLVQVLADFASCFALGALLEEAAQQTQLLGAATAAAGRRRRMALCWGYAISACGYLFLFGPASVAAAFSRATAPSHTVSPSGWTPAWAQCFG
jgi:hypothetical protein